jgi:hypothetical protein
LTDWRDTLLTISEIAIAIIGFTGLIGILVRRQRVEMFSEEFFKLRWMLEYGLGTLGCALLPFLVFSFDPSEAAGWRVSSGVAVGVTLTYLLINRREVLPQVAYSRFSQFFGLGDLVVVLLVLTNALGILFEPTSAPYVTAVYWGLLGATVGFVRLVALVWTPSDTPPPD